MVVEWAASIFNVARLAVTPPIAVNDGTNDITALAVANFTRVVVV